MDVKNFIMLLSIKNFIGLCLIISLLLPSLLFAQENVPVTFTDGSGEEVAFPSDEEIFTFIESKLFQFTSMFPGSSE